MLKRTSLLLLTLSFCLSSYAQGTFNYGAYFSIGTSGLNPGNSNITYDSKLYIGGGATASYMFNSIIGLEVDAGIGISNATSTGSEFVGKNVFNQDVFEDFNDSYTFGYIKIPTLVKISLGNESFKFNISAGPSSNFNVLALQSREYEDQNYEDDNGYSQQTISNAETFIPSAVGGIGLQAKSNDSNWYFINFRYETSLSNVAKIDDSEPNLTSYSISLGYLF